MGFERGNGVATRHKAGPLISARQKMVPLSDRASNVPPATAPRPRATFRVGQYFLLAVACGLVWRVARFGMDFEITGDEAGIMRSVIERDYGELLKPLSYANVSPPLFLWLTKFSDSLFGSDWAARLAPFLAGLGSVGMFWLLCRDALRGTARWVALAVFSVSYFPVVEETRTKGYGIDLFVATVVLWLMLQWELRGHKARYLVWLALCAPVFIWVSYTAVFVIGAAGVILAASMLNRPSKAANRSSANVETMNRGPSDAQESGGCPAVQTLARNSVPSQNRHHGSWRDALADGEWFGWQSGLAVLALAASVGVSAWLLYQLNIRPALQESHTNGLREVWKGGFPPLAQPWKIPWWLLRVQTGRGFAWPIGDDHFGSTATFILWLTGLVVYWRRGNRRVWALFVVTQIMALAAAFAGKYPYLQNPRVCMFLGPGICLFVGAGAQYLIFRFGGNNRRALFCGTALALMIYGLGGLGCDIVLRIREVKGPGIRSTLAEASRLVGPNGQFVVLNDKRGGWVFAYYIKRVVRQPVWWHGQTPPQSGPGSKLALVVRGPTEDNPQANPLFRQFEQRFPRRLTVTWSQVSHQVLIGSKDTTTVWVCE